MRGLWSSTSEMTHILSDCEKKQPDVAGKTTVFVCWSIGIHMLCVMCDEDRYYEQVVG